MKTLRRIIVVVCMLIPSFVFAGGSMEESSTGSVQFQAAQGIISRPEEVITSSFISAIDYHYPEPEGDFGVYIYSGNRQIPASGGPQVFTVGIQGARLAMADLPPMNLCFVIDHSGSMSSANKMEWVWESFDIFIDTVRDTDYVSIVKFDNSAEVVFSSTRISNREIREKLRQAVRSIHPAGGTNLTVGLELGYQQAMTNFRKEYTNRVLFLTDGKGDSEGMLEMAETFKDIGINVSTIGLGTGFNGELLRSVAKAGAGTSRFISDRETMREVFGTGLSRMVVPVLRNLELTVRLPTGSGVTNTWAYDYAVEGNTVTYTYPAIHVGDYETIVLQADLPKLKNLGKLSLLEVTGAYTDSGGQRKQMPKQVLSVQVVEAGKETDGFSDAIVLRAGTVLKYAEALKKIGSIYYGADGTSISKDDPNYSSVIADALGIANSAKKELYSVEERLEFDGFTDEIKVIESYIRILGGELAYSDEQVKEFVEDREPEVKPREYPFPNRVESLFRELSLTLEGHSGGTMVVSGFSFKDDRAAPILDFLTSFAETSFTNNVDFPVVSRQDLEKVLEEQELALSGLFETENAIAVGELLSARYMVTGTVIEMGSAVIIFSRIIDIESSEILGATQIIVEKDENMATLLLGT